MEVRTTLQRLVQVLKWHCMLRFIRDPDNRPPSILITTLAARAYRGEADLFTATRNALAGMGERIEDRHGIWWVPNPAHEEENFADKWNEYPERREAFVAWHRDIPACSTSSPGCTAKGYRWRPPAWRRASATTRVRLSAHRYGDRPRGHTEAGALRMTGAGMLSTTGAGVVVRGTLSMASTPTRAVNPARQLSAIRAVLPAATGTIRRGELYCQMPIQPSLASQRYTVRLRYRNGRRPRVTVVDPPLARRAGAHALPDVYPGDELCLYYPGQWRHDMLLAATILPWTSEWLLRYELWLITGTWTGGGHSARGNDAAVADGGPV